MWVIPQEWVADGRVISISVSSDLRTSPIASGSVSDNEDMAWSVMGLNKEAFFSGHLTNACVWEALSASARSLSSV